MMFYSQLSQVFLYSGTLSNRPPSGTLLLRRLHVLPRPVNCPGTNHLFYTLELQQQCLQVKQTGIGVNGQPVMFYLPRKHKVAGESCAGDANLDYFAMKLFGLLKNMGATLRKSQLRTILKRVYPNGLPEWPIDQAELKKIFNHAGGKH